MFEVKILEKSLISEKVCKLVLVSIDGSPLPTFSAGAHIDIHLPSGLIRQYSLLNPTDSRCYDIAVLMDSNSRGGSEEIHQLLEQGQTIQVSTPRNLFPLTEGRHHSVLVAGGIGITPILAMARELRAKGRSFKLHYSARSRKAAAFADELSNGEFSTVSHFYFSDEDQSIDIDTVLSDAQHGSHLYVCGPSGFIDFVVGRAASAQWSEERIHQERFNASLPSVNQEEEQVFDLLIKSSGQVIQVAQDETALEALENAGIEVDVSCEMGICGSCLTPVIEGIPDHRDSFQSDSEKSQNRFFTPCCSRAKTPRLVVDL